MIDKSLKNEVFMRLRFISIIFLILFSFNAFSSPVIEINSGEMLTDYLSHSPFNGVILVSKNNEVILKKAFGYKKRKSHSLSMTSFK